MISAVLWTLALAPLAVGPAPAKAKAKAAGDVNAAWLLSSAEEQDALLTSRLLEVSRGFLDTPYVHSPLGEGQGKDPDPTLRFDAVDCLTYVEQVMALALARSPAEVAPLLARVRYGSGEAPVYEDRNHLMEAQWLPNNVRKGYLVDVTRRFGGADTVRTQKVLTAESWSSVSSRALELPPERQATGTFELDLIPIPKVMPRIREIPDGTLLLVVREDRPRKVTRITHLGFVVQKKRRAVLRHAARSHYRKVVDEDLETFLTRNSKYSKWKVAGVALYRVRLPDVPALTARGAGP